MVERALRAADLAPILERRTHLLAVGKASPFMAAAAADKVPGALAAATVIGTHCPFALPPPLIWTPASHPVPDEHSLEAGRRAMEMAARVGPDEVLLVLLSGGASSLLALPRSGVTLEDKQATTRQLLRGGADINGLNCVRKHISAVKGGQLAAQARGQTLCLAVSDVVTNDLSVIGSGPTVADPTTFADALAVLERHGGLDRFPATVVRLLQAGVRGETPETPKPGGAWEARTETRIIGSRQDALDAAADAATSLGYEVVVEQQPIVGEAREAGPRLVRVLEEHRMRRRSAVSPVADARPLCMLAAGETTVTVKGGGRGGRNQELTLAAARELRHVRGPAAILSGGTDGIDGPTDAAGAVADSSTLGRAAVRGLADPARFLDENNAYAFFQALSDLVLTGPTDTNVGDIQILLAG